MAHAGARRRRADDDRHAAAQHRRARTRAQGRSLSSPSLRVRWSEHEARKPYARPFGVSFLARDETIVASIAVSGHELLYARHFQRAVLALAGELFGAEILAAEEPQTTWLDTLASLLPPVRDIAIQPRSRFDQHAGRVFEFAVITDGRDRCAVDALSLADYQEFQAAVAHATGALYREPSVEAITDDGGRHAAWWAVLRECVARPGADDRIAAEWPWR